MGEKRYIISDASKMIDVESHVLRYWEDELDITIPRNEMGHRYYTDFHINLLKNIKELKDHGFQLKAIKMLVPELMSNGTLSSEGLDIDTLNLMKDELNNVGMDSSLQETHGSDRDDLSKMEQFQLIIGNIVSKALEENNAGLSKDVSDRVSDNVIKELDYQMRIKEEREEERFKKIDELIRNSQKGRQEIALTAEKRRFHKIGKLFGKK